MKKKAKYVINNIVGYFLVKLFLSKNKLNDKNRILSIYFHNPPPRIFEDCVRFLYKNSFVFLSSQMLEDIISSKKTIDKRYAVISFDDAWRNNLKLIPIIEKYNVNLTLFVPVEPIISGNYWWEYGDFLDKVEKKKNLSLAELKKLKNEIRLSIIKDIKSKISLSRSSITIEELQDYAQNKHVTIGSHTINHPITLRCSDDELIDEYFGSKRVLESWLNKEVRYFAYPNGDYNARDIDYLKKAGYSMAYSTQNDTIRVDVDKFQIPRFLINDESSYYENIAKMFGIWQSFFLTRIIHYINELFR